MRNDRWSYDAEIRDVLEGGAWEEGSGPILSFRNGRAYRYTSVGHMIFLGVSGSGKSRRGTIPMIKSFIRAGESFIAVDPKGECYDQTGAEAQAGYDVHVIDFRHIFESERWNPLAAPYELFKSGDPVKKQVAIEMISCGVPVLSSSFGGASELNASGAFRFAGGDMDDFTEKLVRIYRDRNLLRDYWQQRRRLTTMDDHVRALAAEYGVVK